MKEHGVLASWMTSHAQGTKHVMNNMCPIATIPVNHHPVCWWHCIILAHTNRKMMTDKQYKKF
jgi:hypothetical protein